MAISVQISSVSAAASHSVPRPGYFGFPSAMRKAGELRYSLAPPKQASSRQSGITSNDFNREGREVGTEEVASAVIGAALAVHRELGPGLLESTYELCLAQELGSRDLGFERQHMLPVTYRDLVLPSAYRIDFLVEEQVIVEIKSVAGLESVHMAQVLTYLKLSGCTLGLLINFNVIMLRDGIRRLVLNHQEPSRPLRFNAVGRMPV